jgi:Tol biopolymer transport system component
MRRFTILVVTYLVACLIAMALIVIRGDGPHPQIVAVYPPNGDRYFPGGIVAITFNQTMDHASVDRALQVSPGSQGQGAWYGNTLNLQPVGDWRPNVTYRVSLTGQVADTEGRPLHTPVSFWFRVHHVERVGFCAVEGVRNVCDETDAAPRPLTRSPQPVLQYALSPDGSMLAYTRRDGTELPHLFIVNADGTGALQLSKGTRYADSSPSWTAGDENFVSYLRRPVLRGGAHPHLGKAQLWSVQTDGSENSPY